MKIAELLVQDGEEHDDVLHMEGAPVNIRLFRQNDDYRHLIFDIIRHMKRGAEIEFEDYPAAQGVSGANIGIPLNIVIVVTKNDTEVFLNPEIVEESFAKVECQSNCGSINLPEKITVMRHRWVKVKYYDISGHPQEFVFRIGDDTDPVSSATLQHEIEHNLGILVTDKEVKNG